jgi:hypothetical protein
MLLQRDQRARGPRETRTRDRKTRQGIDIRLLAVLDVLTTPSCAGNEKPYVVVANIKILVANRPTASLMYCLLSLRTCAVK